MSLRRRKLTTIMVATMAIAFFAAPPPARAFFRYVAGDFLQGIMDVAEYLHRLVQGFL